ncbi:ATP-binding protein [Limnoraphis robusta]|uniref:histidine kinase n=1 Tax=Limnoraphis robusta CCNP1315 TaxID=3110306 RepID=A0ABU5U1Y0_9CYAN|nr:ATP-binding protein [Limnoraphis robusta]MEA5521201.1 ATP-binding protein [Limnoraphis robusta CCNP1315]MEA5546649.1 ATP-binding protein [Limnoraphis robusta CCNP1324]
MTQNKTVTGTNVNLTNCDREQIHIPGLIQPHGVLLSLQEPNLRIVQVSRNVENLLGFSPDELLNQTLDYLLDAEQIEAVRQCLSGNFEYLNPITVSLHSRPQSQAFNGIVHYSEGLAVLELEPLGSRENAGFTKFYTLTKRTITLFQQAKNFQELCSIIVREIRQLTGFDRVMIYKFDEDDSGHVIAENKLEELEPYLGLHYPATDIPLPARKLYCLNFLRLIPDVNYQSVELIPANNPLTQNPLDLSYSVLRSVSPIHLEYLENMGVKASLSISLIKDNKLWGLVACHHESSDKYVPYEIRTACEFLGQVMSLQIPTKEQNENLDYQVYLRKIQSEITLFLSTSDDLLNVLVDLEDPLLQLVSASGAALYIEDNLQCIGQTPNETEIKNLIDWIQLNIDDSIYYTDSLPKVYPSAQNFKSLASGLLVLEIGKVQPNYILWFRSEVIQTVNWAGNPQKPPKVEADGSLTLFPRKSFELWQETVESKSLPWQSCEIENAQELKNAILSIVLRRLAELSEVNLQLSRSNNELDSFAYIASHDLKEPLRGIHNYSTFLMEDYSEILDDAGREKLKTLVRLTQRMEDLINTLLHFSRLGRQELNRRSIDLNLLVENVTEVLRISQPNESITINIPQPLPVILGDRILIEEVFSNLMSNAVKYNENSHKSLEIGCLETEVNPCTLYVRDNGIGIQEKHLDTIFKIFKRLHGRNRYGGGTGAGLTIVKKIIERHGGQIWIESEYGQGTTFYFTLNPKQE